MHTSQRKTREEALPDRRWTALGALATSCLAVLLVLLDNTVVVVALPTLANELDTSFRGLQWVVDSYTLPFAGFLLMFGYLGDRFGRRRILLGGLAGIAVMSFVGAVAESVTQVLIARAGMGIAAAAVFPATLAIITTEFRTRRARALGIATWTAMSGFAVAIGPRRRRLVAEPLLMALGVLDERPHRPGGRCRDARLRT